MKSVVICGSRRFKTEARNFATALRRHGVTVYEPHFRDDVNALPEDLAELDRRLLALGLTFDHFHKIDLADAVFILNIDGYAGVSTTLEIGYAVAAKKPIYALSDRDPELSRATLFQGFASTPEKLTELLK